jgi:hypothetical protein
VYLALALASIATYFVLRRTPHFMLTVSWHLNRYDPLCTPTIALTDR